jgi:hypothetical protein
MMKKIMIFGLFLLCSSCKKEGTYIKPFVITYKGDCYENKCIYELQDKNNEILIFSDSIGKYNIGDIIK